MPSHADGNRYHCAEPWASPRRRVVNECHRDQVLHGELYIFGSLVIDLVDDASSIGYAITLHVDSIEGIRGAHRRRRA